ncbi:MAG: hypothetical protein EOM91_06875 [Sphingobacteriia bacterium]|nr:hypothetical protein [Sphingobacteriia bacterium]NCC39806.1 hypothetical protein [Gammaproteobacteria bacterium]
MSIEPFRRFIKDRLGLHFGTDAESRLRTLLASRLDATQLDKVEAYLDRAARDPLELDALTNLLTINETYFYREPRHLELLVERLVPMQLDQTRGRTPLRILSLGCSSGEEPYSIAIALRERYGEQAERLFAISACDVDAAVLQRARAASYGPLAFRALPPSLRARWFTPVDANQRRLDPAIIRQVHFFRWNLIDPSEPRHIARQDLIFFRNVSIYFDLQTRMRVIEQIRELMQPHAFLIVGASETLANDFGLLHLRNLDGVFLFGREPAPGPPGCALTHHPARAPRADTHTPYTRPLVLAPRPGRARSDDDGAPAHPLRTQTPGPAVATPTPSTAPIDRPPRDPYAHALELARAERFDAALAELEPVCQHPDATADALVLLALLLRERGARTAASAVARRALALAPWSSEALLLLARNARLDGDDQAALEALRRVIYDNPNDWRAHYQLAELYRARGETTLARREYLILRHQLQDEQAVMASAGPLPSPLAPRDLRLLCEARLTALADTAT